MACLKIHACLIMHVQTIPKSPPKIIVQVAKVVTFFLALCRGTSEARDEHSSTEMLNFRCECERCRLLHRAYLCAEARTQHPNYH